MWNFQHGRERGAAGTERKIDNCRDGCLRCTCCCPVLLQLLQKLNRLLRTFCRIHCPHFAKCTEPPLLGTQSQAPILAASRVYFQASESPLNNTPDLHFQITIFKRGIRQHEFEPKVKKPCFFLSLHSTNKINHTIKWRQSWQGWPWSPQSHFDVSPQHWICLTEPICINTKWFVIHIVNDSWTNTPSFFKKKIICFKRIIIKCFSNLNRDASYCTHVSVQRTNQVSKVACTHRRHNKKQEVQIRP